MAHFEIQDLTFSYPNAKSASLDGVRLSVEKGEYIVLCGASGSGKTTLLRHLKTVLTPHGKRGGTILFNGTPIHQVSQREQSAKIGFVMQDPDDQIVTDKVWHELAFGLESLGTDQKTMRLRVAEMASYFGIQDWFHRDVANLSGGQKQLLNLASIMAMQPEVLILDEPTSQLDPIAASDFLNTVRKINLELGTTIIITEHRLEDIYHAADRVVVMENGTVAANDTPRNVGTLLYRQKSEMFTALPTPVRVFYTARSQGDCPLTVREGRSWLTRTFSERPLKVVYLFGRFSPRLSLFLAILLRMMPRLKQQAGRISTARKALGRGIDQGNILRRMVNGLRIFSMLITWLLEALATISGSMRSRGCALKGRTAFSIYRFDNRDRGLVIGMFTCLTVTAMAVVLGQTDMTFAPRIIMEPVTPGSAAFYIGYAVLCLLPMALEVICQFRFEQLRRKV